MSPIPLSAVVAVTIATSTALAQGSSGREAAAGDSSLPLFTNLGTHHHAITTRSPRAQQYFDQGLRFTYAFNHEEAVNSFREGARLDSRCAMCWWGVALALGPNINAPMDSAAGAAAFEAATRARALSAHVTPVERAYIVALATRYATRPPADRAPLDSAYAAAMRALARRYASDNDAATLFAEAMLDLRPWDQWREDGTPQPGTLEAVTRLERVLARAPNHAGACHYYIHAIEASPHPERALPCARRLAALMPGAGHIVHMPAHLYMRLGLYDEAGRTNVHAAHADERYFEGGRRPGIYQFYYAHNLHFLWAARMMEGRGSDALAAARAVAARVTPDVARSIPPAEAFVPTPLFALARFGLWDELLREPAPPADLAFVRGMWYYARGLALVATGRADSASVASDSLAAIAAAFPRDRPAGVNTGFSLLAIAVPVLRGEIALRQGHADAAAAHFRRAVGLQDALRYDEPPPWYFPVRESLGRAYLAAGNARAAEAAFRADLRRNRASGWSLYGLARSLRAQGRTAEAARAEREWRRAWARADSLGAVAIAR